MYIVRDIMYLKFGHYRDAKALLDEAKKKNLLPQAESQRILSDFTGDSYRLILEEGFETLADFEQHLQASMAGYDWKQWYEQFKQHVDHSHREVLKVVQ